MNYLSHLTRLFQACVPPAHEEIEQHVRRLNRLLLASQQLKTGTMAEWNATERELEMEVQWFDIHRLTLTRTADPLLSPAVQTTDAIGLNRHLTLTHCSSR